MPDTSQRKISGAVVPVGLVVVALVLGWVLLKTGPTTTPVEERRPPKLVRTKIVHPADHPIILTAHGSVVPSQRVTIQPQVTGNVMRLHPNLIPGGIVNADEELFFIDPTLTELDIRENKAEEIRAKANLAEAERKWNEGRQLAEERVIADTELASLDSAVRIADAELQRIQARLSRNEELLARHRVAAPFNAMVLRESVELGQRVSPGDETVTLVGTDEFRVQAAIPVDQLPWIRLPSNGQPGAQVRVVMDTGGDAAAEFEGEVIQLQGDISDTSRMARILIGVKDPLQRQRSGKPTPLLLGSYVRVEIDAGTLENVLAIERAALRENDKIWIVDAQGLLQIRDARIRWRRDEIILIDPVIQPGEQLILSELPVALPDTPVQAQAETEPSEQIAATTPES
jgi:RND family efflux transporter MFP subunit